MNELEYCMVLATGTLNSLSFLIEAEEEQRLRGRISCEM
jgi:hypothetical protein